MNKKGSTRIIFLAVLAFLALILAASAFLSWQKEKEKRVSLEVQVDQLERKKKDLEFTLTAQRKESNDLKNKLSETETDLLSISTQFDNEKADKERLSRNLEQLKNELKTTADMKAKFESELLKTKKELEEAKARVNDLLRAKQKLEATVRELRISSSSKVELGKIVITPKKQDKFEAQILTTNNEYNFVVINLGQKDGFKTSDVFFVENAKGDALGKGYIEEAKEVMSVLSLSERDTARKLKEGEKLILKVQ